MNPAGHGGVGRPAAFPVWTLILTLLLLMVAVGLGRAGLTALQGLPQVSMEGLPLLVTTPEEAISRALAGALERAPRHHPVLFRVMGGVQLGTALLMLLAVAAVFTRDLRGRRMVVIAAAVGIAYQVVNAVFMLAVVRPAILHEAPPLIAELAATGRDRSDALAGKVHTALAASTVFFTVASTLLGIAFHAMLIRFFGGARGRKLYGVRDP